MCPGNYVERRNRTSRHTHVCSVLEILRLDYRLLSITRLSVSCFQHRVSDDSSDYASLCTSANHNSTEESFTQLLLGKKSYFIVSKPDPEDLSTTSDFPILHTPFRRSQLKYSELVHSRLTKMPIFFSTFAHGESFVPWP